MTRAQRPADAGDGAAGADAGDERVGARRPSCARISGPVVARCTPGLVGFLNCSGMKALGLAAAIALALSTAPRMTRSAGVRCSSAPYARSSAMRSGDMFSGMVRISR